MTKLSWKAAGVALVVASCEHTERFDASPPAERAARQELIVAAGGDPLAAPVSLLRRSEPIPVIAPAIAATAIAAQHP